MHKRIGPQYFGGIIEVTGNPPGDDARVVHIMNKEDIWISKIRVPITGSVEEEVNQDCEELDNIGDLDLCNIFNTQWTPSSILNDPFDNKNKCLELKDDDPCDYAKVQDQKGNRPIRLRFESDWLNFDIGTQKAEYVHAVEKQKWYNVKVNVNCDSQSYSVNVDCKLVAEKISFDVETESLERIEFRTGPYRGMVSPVMAHTQYAIAGYETEDLPGSEVKSIKSAYLINDVVKKEE